MKAERSIAWAEVIETAVIIVSAVLLILEVRANTNALEHAAYLERSGTYVTPYLEVEGFTEIYEKVKTVDAGDVEPMVLAFQERYDLSVREAVVWVRHLDMIWRTFQADFLFGSDRETLAGDVAHLLDFPDQQLYYRYGRDLLHPRFRDYLDDLGLTLEVVTGTASP